jgi:histidyl-tRNA synthetase
VSVGVSRLVAGLLGTVTASRPVPAAVWVAVVEEGQRDRSAQVARQLRGRGIPADVSPNSAKFGRQIKAAADRQIPYVWFPSPDGDEVKDIRSGDQTPADPQTWTPPESDWWPTVGQIAR